MIRTACGVNIEDEYRSKMMTAIYILHWLTGNSVETRCVFNRKPE